MCRFIEKRRIILYPLFLLLLTASCTPEPEEQAEEPEEQAKAAEAQVKAPEDQIKAYQEARNRGDVEKELSFFTEDIKFEVVKQWRVEGKKALRSLFESSAAVNSRIVLTDLKVDGNKITCKIKEESDWLKHAGIGALNYEFGQFTFEKGLIKEVRLVYTQTSEEAMKEYVTSFAKWASENRSKEFDKLRRTGFVTKENIDMYFELLREWREDIKKQEDIKEEEQ